MSNQTTHTELLTVAKAGDKQARLEVVQRNRGLIGLAARESRARRHLEEDDVQQAGYCGLLEAIDTYQAERGRFTTHAVWKIRGWLEAAIRNARRNHFERLGDRSFFSRDSEQPLSLTATISSLLPRLSRVQREVVCLSYGLGAAEPKSSREIGLLLCLPASTVRLVRRQALHELARLLE
jgi:RNA polymerase sigma factor (sigma-70 family)